MASKKNAARSDAKTDMAGDTETGKRPHGLPQKKPGKPSKSFAEMASEDASPAPAPAPDAVEPGREWFERRKAGISGAVVPPADLPDGPEPEAAPEAAPEKPARKPRAPRKPSPAADDAGPVTVAPADPGEPGTPVPPRTWAWRSAGWLASREAEGATKASLGNYRRIVRDFDAEFGAIPADDDISEAVAHWFATPRFTIGKRGNLLSDAYLNYAKGAIKGILSWSPVDAKG